MRVDEVMTRGVIALRPSMSLKDAARVLTLHRITGAPVVDAGRLVGVLSESDIVAKETSGYLDTATEHERLRRERAAVTVGDAMTPAPVVVAPWNTVALAADRMIARQVNRLPVVDPDGTVVGIVTRTDLVRAFIRSDAAIVADVRERLLPSVGLSPAALDVRAGQGVVRISGRVDSELAATCLRNTAHLIPGVVDVVWEVEAPVEPRRERAAIAALSHRGAEI